MKQKIVQNVLRFEWIKVLENYYSLFRFRDKCVLKIKSKFYDGFLRFGLSENLKYGFFCIAGIQHISEKKSWTE